MSDHLFYYDTVPVSDSIANDLLAGIVQPKRRLFYNRAYGCDLSRFLDAPNTLFLQVMIAYEIMALFAARNGRVTDGSGATFDRRAATSQDQIAVTPVEDRLDVEVGYVELRNVAAPRTLTWSVSR